MGTYTTSTAKKLVSLLERKTTQISLKLGNKIKTVVTNNLNYESTYPNTDAISCGPKLKK